jgi:hypothetical protein
MSGWSHHRVIRGSVWPTTSWSRCSCTPASATQGQSGVPEIVATELLVPEFCDYLIPVGRVPKSARLDTASARTTGKSFAQITRATRAQ